MALLINTNVTTVHGQTLTSSYVRLKAEFDFDQENLTIYALFYPSEQHYLDGHKHLRIVEIPRSRLGITLSSSQYKNATMNDIHLLVESRLETILGSNTVTVDL